MAARGVLQLALARVAAVSTPGHRRARHVALGPEATWIALAKAKDPVATHRGAHHWAAPFALFAVITCWEEMKKVASVVSIILSIIYSHELFAKVR